MVNEKAEVAQKQCLVMILVLHFLACSFLKQDEKKERKFLRKRKRRGNIKNRSLLHKKKILLQRRYFSEEAESVFELKKAWRQFLKELLSLKLFFAFRRKQKWKKGRTVVEYFPEEK